MQRFGLLHLVVIVLCALLAPATSHALATYSAQATTTLTVTGFADGSGTPLAKPSDLIVEGDAYVFDEFDSKTGDATALASATAQVSAADPFDLTLGEGPSQDAQASGSAAYPPNSTSDATARTDGLIFLDNMSATATYRVDFELSFSWLVDASAISPDEIARAEISLLLDALSEGVMFELLELADTATGDGPGSSSSVFAGSLTLAPGEFDELTIRTDAIGSARAVPEPSTALLVAVGLVWVGAQRRAFAR